MHYTHYFPFGCMYDLAITLITLHGACPLHSLHSRVHVYYDHAIALITLLGAYMYDLAMIALTIFLLGRLMSH